jgi:hypothetical protein
LKKKNGEGISVAHEEMTRRAINIRRKKAMAKKININIKQ